MDELVITPADVKRGQALLRKYRDGRAQLEKRLVEDEQWWELRHWEALRRKGQAPRPFGAPPFAQGGQEGCGENGHTEPPASAWLFNAVVSKHADAMDSYPEPLVLPREESDRRSAALLTEVLPVVLENAGFAQTWSDNWWEKLKHGTAAYGVFWDAEKDNGLGDVAIRRIDLLSLFWEPGIDELQKSRNLFLTELADNDLLTERWPQLAGKLGGDAGGDLGRCLCGGAADTSEKSVVVDWYYKKRGPDGRERLHFVKFVSDELLYASENDPACRETGFYEHGLYPVVLDTLFPEKGTPVGFGYVAVCKDPQTCIDRLFGNILDYAARATNPRYFMAASTGVNEREFLDWSKPVVRVEGTLDDTRIRQITMEPLSSVYTNIIGMKIDEMKDTAANRDVTNGGVSGGVTAASAIAALQEAGNKVSRDMIAASYRADEKIVGLVLELIRQFYDVGRAFRVAAPNGAWRFASLSGAALREKRAGISSLGETLWRRPVFDLKISAQKKNPFSVLEQNERAKELFSLGFFDPRRAREALGALEMMRFEGVEQVKESVREGLEAENPIPQSPAATAPFRKGGLTAPQPPAGSYIRALAGRSAPDV